MTNSNNHKRVDATLWEKQASIYKETFLNLLIKFPCLFYRTTGNRSISIVMGMICVSLKSLFFKATKNKVVFSYGLLCFMLFDLVVAQAQSPENRGAAEGQTEVKPLGVGDVIPEEIWNLPLKLENHPEGKETIALSEYKDKLIILDFWATWCASCLDAFPKIAELNRRFKNDLMILPVNGKYTKDTKAKIKKVFERFYTKTGFRLNLPYVWEDSILSRLFEHAIIPHLVWIDGQGKVLTFTHAGELNDINIAHYLETKQPPANVKNDMSSFVRELPISKQLEFTDLGKHVQQSTFTGYIEGIGTEAGNYYNNNGLAIYRVTNYPLSYLFTISNLEMLSDMKNSQIVLDGRLPPEFVQAYKSPDPYNDTYCFELISTDSISPKMAMRSLQTQLNEYFQVTLKKIEEEVPILVVKETPEVYRFRSRHPLSEIQYHPDGKIKRMQRQMIGALLEYFASTAKIYIDDSNLRLSVLLDIDIPSTLDIESKDQIMDFLRSLGLPVSETVGPVEFALFEPLIY